MKQFFKMFFASMLAMIVTVVIIIGVTIGMIVAAASQLSTLSSTPKLSARSVMVVDLSQTYYEGDQVNSFAAFFNETYFTPGLARTARTILKAREDDRIEGILLKSAHAANGWTTLLQLRQALQLFRESGKFVYAYGDQMNQGNYLVASVSDSVFLHPQGHFSLRGLATVMPFFQATLEKLEIEPEIFYAGKFKSATEPFRRRSMSPENRHQIEQYQRTIWTHFTEQVGKSRGLEAKTVDSLAQATVIQWPTDALEHGLIDGLFYWDELEDAFRKRMDMEKDSRIHYVSLGDYAQNLKTERSGGEGVIAVLIAEGEIVDGKSNEFFQIDPESMRREIRKIRQNDQVKAVVLRVNSPGGSPLAAESILRDLHLLAEEKPLIVSMGDMATSGGYYIACQADSIFAAPTTLTGSIGVFGMLFVVQDFLSHKLGVEFDEVKNAPSADFPTGIREITAKERDMMQYQVDRIYEVFLQRVAEGRNIPMDSLEEIAQGRVWSGEDAWKLGLVDGLGGIDRALSSAAAAAGMEEIRIRTYPNPAEKVEAMFRSLATGMTSADLSAALEARVRPSIPYLEQVQKIREMNGKVMAISPFSFWEVSHP